MIKTATQEHPDLTKANGPTRQSPAELIMDLASQARGQSHAFRSQLAEQLCKIYFAAKGKGNTGELLGAAGEALRAIQVRTNGKNGTVEIARDCTSVVPTDMNNGRQMIYNFYFLKKKI